MSGQGSDKRQEERVPLLLPLQAQAGGRQEFLAHSYDISLSGLRIYMPHSLARKESLRLRLNLPEELNPLEAYAQVSWAKKQRAKGGVILQAGVCLRDMSALDRARWAEFVERQREQLRGTAVYWEEKQDIEQLKRKMRAYLISLGRRIVLISSPANPFSDFWGIDSQGNPVLLFVYEAAEKENIMQIIDGMEWFLSQGAFLKKHIPSLSLRQAPHIMAVAFCFKPGFLKALKYLKSFSLELLQVSFITSGQEHSILTKSLPLPSALPLVEDAEPEEKKAGFAPSAESISPENDIYYAGLDKEHQKIMKWISKI